MSRLQHLILCVNYNGKAYRGWQTQLNPQIATVQAHLESALAKIADKEIRTYCAGRTDAGVHASCQIVHCAPQIERPIKAWVAGVNSHLPADIRVRWAVTTGDDFHARFSATARSYRYIVHNALTPCAILHGLVTPVLGVKLDAERMHQAAQYLLGEQDFSSFRASGCQSNTPFRCVHAASVKRQGEFIFFDIKANAFLLHMVRNIAGLLIDIGKGKHSVVKMQEVLQLKNRCAAEMTAPPYGLYLVAVDYPQHFNLPATFYLPQLAAVNSTDFLHT